MLDLAQNSKIKTIDIEQGEIIIYSDNKRVVKECCKEVGKASNCTKEAGGTLEHAKREVESMKFDVTLEYSNGKHNPPKEFYQQLGA